MLTKVHIVKTMVFPVVMYGYESWAIKKAECWRTDTFELWCWRRLLRIPWTARDWDCSQSQRKSSALNIHWKDWCWSSNTLATWCKELTLWKRHWCWERLKAGREGDDREQDSWMTPLSQWAWVKASVRKRQGGLAYCIAQVQRVGCNWATEKQHLIHRACWNFQVFLKHKVLDRHMTLHCLKICIFYINFW